MRKKLSSSIITSIETEVKPNFAKNKVLVIDLQNLAFNKNLVQPCTYDQAVKHLHTYKQTIKKYLRNEKRYYSEIVAVNFARAKGLKVEFNEPLFDDITDDDILPLIGKDPLNIDGICIRSDYKSLSLDDLCQTSINSFLANICDQFIPKGYILMSKSDLDSNERTSVINMLKRKELINCGKSLSFKAKNEKDPESERMFYVHRYSNFYLSMIIDNMFTDIVNELHMGNMCKMITSCMEDDLTIANYIRQQGNPHKTYYVKSNDSDVLCNLATIKNVVILFNDVRITPYIWWNKFLGTTLSQVSINLLWGMFGSDYTAESLKRCNIKPLRLNLGDDYISRIKSYINGDITDDNIRNHVKSLLANASKCTYYKTLVLGFEMPNMVKHVEIITNHKSLYKSIFDIRAAIIKHKLWRFKFGHDGEYFTEPDKE